MICPRPVAEAAIASPAGDDLCAFTAAKLPLLRWGSDALADAR